jgi:DNA-binding MarR family transcriptional regulator
MQVLVLAVQNAVDYADLGVATSGATLFRFIGGSLGTAVFGAIFTNRLTHELMGAAPQAASQQGRLSPDQLRALPSGARHAYEIAFVNALSTVFVVAACVAAVAFLLSLLLPEVPLRGTAAASGPRDHFAVPRDDNSQAEIEHALSVLARRDTRRRFVERVIADAGVDIEPLEAWTLARIDEGLGDDPAALGRRIDVDPSRVEGAEATLRRRGLVADGLVLTESGHEVLDRLHAARRERLAQLLDGWSHERHEELVGVLQRMASDLSAERPVATSR